MNARNQQQKTVSQRRNFLKKAAKFTAAGALAGWLPLARISAAQATNCVTPGNFPLDIALYKQTFQNWAGDIKVDDVWTCAPANAQQVIKVVNWARDNGYKVRPRGMMHNWSPLTLPAGAL